MSPDASVVVPVRDDPEALGRCLGALGEQRVPARIEALVVDDGSLDPAAVEAAVAGLPWARVIRRPPLGPAAARNAGARAASAPFVCFTDADCTPHPDWVDELLAALRAGADAVAGRTLDGEEHTVYSTATQAIVDHLGRTAAGGGSAFLAGANFGCRRDVLLRHPFDETFPTAAAEDRDLTHRLARAGRSLVVAPAAVVVHHSPLGPAGFLRQHYRYGRGAWRLRRMRSDFRKLERLSFYAELLAAGFDRGPAVGSLVAVAQVATGLGVAREALARPRRARRAARDRREPARAPRP